MTAPSGRIDAYLVCGGAWHDFDFARLELLKLLAEDERVRVKVAEHYEDIEAITAADFLVTYTCDVRPSEAAQQALRALGRGRRPVVRPPRDERRHRPAGGQGRGPVHHPAGPSPLFADTLGSQFLSHPTIEPYPVTISPGRRGRPARRGHRGLRRHTTSCTCASTTASSSRSCRPAGRATTHGVRRGFVAGRRPPAGDVPPAPRRWLRAVPHPGPLPRPLRHGRLRPYDGSYWPTVERGSWEVAEFYELLRRGLSWAAAPARAAVPPRSSPRRHCRSRVPPAGGDDAGVEAGQVQAAVEAGVLDLQAAVHHHVQAGVVGLLAPPRRPAARAGTTASRHRRRWPPRPPSGRSSGRRNTSTRSGTRAGRPGSGTTGRPRISWRGG